MLSGWLKKQAFIIVVMGLVATFSGAFIMRVGALWGKGLKLRVQVLFFLSKVIV